MLELIPAWIAVVALVVGLAIGWVSRASFEVSREVNRLDDAWERAARSARDQFYKR